MTEHSYTEVSSQSWLSRLAGAFVGLIFGLVLFFVAFPLLFWNEGRAVDRFNALEEGSGAVISVTSEQVNAANDKKLVHLSGFADTNETLVDKEFGVSENALKLRREVQLYQWQENKSTEKKKKLGGGEKTVTTYSYEKVWSDALIDSSMFHKSGYDNPRNIAFRKQTSTAQNVSLDAFALSPELVRKVRNYQSITIEPNSNTKLPDNTKAHAGGYYIGTDPTQPEVGDLKVSFSKVAPQEVSVVAQQSGTSFETYTTSNDGSILLLETGQVDAQAMFQTAITENTILTWALRGAGLFCMFTGLCLFFRPISVFADVVPIFGDIAGAGIGLVSFMLAVTLSAITIAVAWVLFRPVIGIALLVFAIAAIWLVRKRLKAARTRKIEPVATPAAA